MLPSPESNSLAGPCGAGFAWIGVLGSDLGFAKAALALAPTIEPRSEKCNVLFGLAGYVKEITYNFKPTFRPSSRNFARGSGSNPSFGRGKPIAVRSQNAR